VIGHLTADLKAIALKSSSELVKTVMTGLYYVCPNLEALNIKGLAAQGAGVPLSYQALASAYGMAYAAVLITAACAVFSRRDF